MSSGGQSGDVFFRFNLRCSIKSPQFNKLRKNFINTEGVELFEEVIRAVRNVIRISVFGHDKCDIFKDLKAFNIKVILFSIFLFNICLKLSKVLVDIPSELKTIKARHCCTRLERYFSSVNHDIFLNSHTDYSLVVVVATADLALTLG